jgi:glutamyl-tRNA reductase
LESFYSQGGSIIFSVGVNHHTAPLEIREKVYLSEEETVLLLNQFKEYLSECMIVSTCNRTEVYGVPLNGKLDLELYKNILLNFKAGDGSVNKNQLYNLVSTSAADHLFKVASSMDSMILGDSQIMHQLKEAYQIAQKNQSIGKVLNKLCQTALHVGKRTKSETALYEGAVSISYAAVELAQKIFGDLTDKTILILGAGETAELTAESLIKKRAKKIYISNRTVTNAEELFKKLSAMSKLDGEVLEYENYKNRLNEFDIIISSTASSSFILYYDDFKKIPRRKSGTPILIIDIAVPRDVDPRIGKYGNIFLKDIDDLNAIVEANFEMRKAEIPGVKKIISEELTHFFKWYYSLQLVPTIKEIENVFEEIRLEEILKNTNGFSKKEKETIETLTKNIVQKILRNTVPHLNEMLTQNEVPSQELRYNRLHLIRKLFGLENQAKKRSLDKNH